jgi:thioredoxin reductase (NADPH)
VYAASEGLETTAIDSVAVGGQASTSPRIENYLGFPSGLSGPELMERAVIQARKFGAQPSVAAEATGLAQRNGNHVVRLADGTSMPARAVLVAAGVRYRRLAVPRIEEFEGTCVHYAATQVEAGMCRSEPVAVVGGGNSAGQASLFLARTTPAVHLLIRHDDLGRDMSRYLVDQIERNERVHVWRHTEVGELVGDGDLWAIVAEDNRTGERCQIEAGALFVFIGARPQTGWLRGELALDGRGFVLTGPEAARAATATPRREVGRAPYELETSRPGVFAAGDVRSGSIKRVASAVGEGSAAVRLIHRYLAESGAPAM